ncbi:RIP metalloprotease RseP [Romboutsia maritimum]|uniref:Zinc metalloprotease n=1 Tax=Romboutsia maritimum TaxID=2020948 RepID=A0A255HN84_9FIRM|nr:RIP metalloprotease RseP [Romboutsia maritimum]RDY23898.1 RIP metalloprotease RseP [Romboutsia maritimum]
MTIIAAILLFGIIVFIHELGHFLLAKKSGIKVHEFAIGMGPKLFSIKKDTEYSIRLLPLGGFISMEGEDESSNDPRSFGNKSILQRASVIFAGPFFNIILAIILLIPVFLYMGSPTTTLNKVLDNGPAQRAGIVAGDTITKINNQEVKTWQTVINTLNKSKGKEVNIILTKDGKEKSVNLKPEIKDGRYSIGIETKMKKDFFASITSAFKTTANITVQMFKFLGQLVTGTLPGGIGNSVAGPIGVVGLVSDAAKTGIINLISLGSLISLNLGIFNLLPIPALDGGRLFLLAVEAIRGGKKIDPNKEAMVNLVGFGALMLFMVFITYKDILRLVNK